MTDDVGNMLSCEDHDILFDHEVCLDHGVTFNWQCNINAQMCRSLCRPGQLDSKPTLPTQNCIYSSLSKPTPFPETCCPKKLKY